MLNFRIIYEYLWTSFRVSRDTELVEKLVKEGEGYGILVKRTWYYGLFTILKYLTPILILASINAYFIYLRFEGSALAYVLDVFLIGLTGYLAYLSIKYVYVFKQNYYQGSIIRSFVSILADLEQGDVLFTKFFNQLQTVFFLSILAVIFDIGYIMLGFMDLVSDGIAGGSRGVFVFAEIVCLFGQIYLNRHFNNNVINLEMDYMIVTRAHIYYVDQQSMNSDIRSIDRDKIKSIRSQYPSFIASFFGYGDLDIMLEGGDILTGGVVQMGTIQLPEQAVSNFYELFSGKWRVVSDYTNDYLKKIIEEQHIMPDDPEFTGKIRCYLLSHEKQMQEDYINSQDPNYRKEIYDLYEEFVIKNAK